MRKDSEYLELVSALEQIVAKHCSTKNLFEGQKYRYPVHYIQNEQKYVSDGDGRVHISAKAVPTMKYMFGKHTLEIGNALDEIIAYIDERYSIWDRCVDVKNSIER